MPTEMGYSQGEQFVKSVSLKKKPSEIYLCTTLHILFHVLVIIYRCPQGAYNLNLLVQRVTIYS